MFLLFSLAYAWAQEPIQKAQELIEKTFASEISSSDLELAAIDGMLQSIEEQTGLSGSKALTRQEYEDYLAWQLGAREGYGLRVQLLPGRGYFVESVISEGPADQAGVERGDVIISLADHPFTGLKPEQMLVILNQEYEQSIPIDVVRREELRRFHLEKGSFQLQLLSEGKSLNVHFFGKDVSKQLEQHLLQRPHQPMVIDVRDNEGGVWEEAIAAIDLFLPSDEVIGYRRTMDGVAIPIISKGNQKHDAPVIILINQGTRGPAELFALSLQEHKRVTVLGVPSSGYSSDFRLYNLDEEVIIKIVDTEILSPQKRSWTGQGVEPNILIRQNIALPAYGSSTTDMQLETALRLISNSN